MFEPRGHDMMSGSILYPADAGRLRRRHPLHRDQRLPADVRPRHHRHGHRGRSSAGWCTPKHGGHAEARCAGRRGRGDLHARRRACRLRAHHATSPSYLHAEGVTVDCPGIGELAFDVSYGGNFYAILEPQKNYRDMADFSPGEIHAAVADPAPAVEREHRAASIRRTRPSRASATSSGPASRRTRRPTRAMPSSMATRRSTAAPAAPAPRRAWRSSPPRAS